LKIYLGDLTYDTPSGLSAAVFPLNIGYVASYCKKQFGEKVDITLFKYIDELDRAINESPPDVLGMSNYVWNHRVGLEMFRMLSQKNPHAIKIWGGPNFPLDIPTQKKFLNSFPECDVYVPLEGEVGFSNIIGRALKSNSKEEIRENILSEPIDNCIFLDHQGKFQYTIAENRMKDLDEIPSPYLTGIMDKFFDGRLNPMLQTNRGCPFSCTFCVDGSDAVNKINMFGIERVQNEIEYMASHVKKNTHDLEISDLNFGMYTRDPKICDYLTKTKKEYNFPLDIHVTTGKNNKEKIIQAIERLEGAIRLCMSVQSMDEEVLGNIKRSNISVDKMMELAPAIKKSGLETTSEVILGLPGETVETHLHTLRELIRARMDHIMAYTCMVLKGSQLDTPEQRSMWKLQTKFRPLVNDYAKLSNGRKVVEIEEVIVGSKSLSFEDYVFLRSIDFAVYATNTIPVFKPLLKLLREYDVDVLELFYRMAKLKSEPPDGIITIFENFKQLTKDELWDSPEEIESNYQNDVEYQKLIAGEASFNILYFCTGKAIAEFMTEWCDYTLKIAKELLDEKQVPNEEFLAVSNYCKGLSYNIIGKDRMSTNPEFVFDYDIKKWLENNKTSLRENKLDSPSKIKFCLSQEQYEEIQQKLDVYNDKISAWIQDRKGGGFVSLIQQFWRQPLLVTH